MKVYNPFWKYILLFFGKNTCKYYIFECIDSFFFLPEHHYTAGLYFVIYFVACLVLPFLHWLSVSLSNLISFFFIRSSNDNFHHQMKIFSSFCFSFSFVGKQIVRSEMAKFFIRKTKIHHTGMFLSFRLAFSSFDFKFFFH